MYTQNHSIVNIRDCTSIGKTHSMEFTVDIVIPSDFNGFVPSECIDCFVDRVVSPEDGQIYRFDKNGFHVRTTDIMTGGILYNFTMVPPNRISGSIVSVSGKGGQILRKLHNTF